MTQRRMRLYAQAYAYLLTILLAEAVLRVEAGPVLSPRDQAV